MKTTDEHGQPRTNTDTARILSEVRVSPCESVSVGRVGGPP